MNKYLSLLLFVSFTFFLSCDQGEKVRIVEISTEFGTMKFELYNSTPFHRDNFVKLAKEGFYDDLLFHRVMQGFMVQGGDPDSKGAAPNARLGMGGPGYTVPAEIGAPHFKGTLAAARTGGPSNPEKRSSGSQFYIVQGQKQDLTSLKRSMKQRNLNYNEVQLNKYAELGGRPDLDGEYTVFGEIVEGMDVIDKIAAVETNSADRPLKDVKMKIKLIK